MRIRDWSSDVCSSDLPERPLIVRTNFSACAFSHTRHRDEETMMPDKTYNVLFLCTGNSARSILAEALMNRLGEGRFRAYSAGSFPKGEVHPQALALLAELGFETTGLRSKSRDDFSQPGDPTFDFIFTVCAPATGAK